MMRWRNRCGPGKQRARPSSPAYPWRRWPRAIFTLPASFWAAPSGTNLIGQRRRRVEAHFSPKYDSAGNVGSGPALSPPRARTLMLPPTASTWITRVRLLPDAFPYTDSIWQGVLTQPPGFTYDLICGPIRLQRTRRVGTASGQ